MHNVTVTRFYRDGRPAETATQQFRDGQVVAAQGDVVFKWRPNIPRELAEVEFSNIVVAHGESGNTHVLQCLDRDQALQWMKDATESPSRLTDFAYGTLNPGTEMFVRVPEGGAQLAHEEHDTLLFETEGVYGVVRQFETRGQTRQNVWD